MKKKFLIPLLLILFTLAVQAADTQNCMRIITDFQQQYGNETGYSVLAKKGEAYKKAGSCLIEEGYTLEGNTYYLEAAGYYEDAADKMKAPAKSDYRIKGNLYESAAGLYMRTGYRKKSEGNYQKALGAFSSAKYLEGKQRVHKALLILEGKSQGLEKEQEVKTYNQNFLILGMGGVAFVGIGIMLIQLEKKEK